MTSKEVSAPAGVLDLYAPKFGLHNLGVPGEKTILRVVVRSLDSKAQLIVFGTYVIGSRHVQVSSKELSRLGNSVAVDSIERCALGDFVRDANDRLRTHRTEGNLQLVSGKGGVSLSIGGGIAPAKVKYMYASGGKLYSIVQCYDKELKIVLGSDELEMFDLQRRKLVGLSLRNGKLTLLRAFQHQ